MAKCQDLIDALDSQDTDAFLAAADDYIKSGVRLGDAYQNAIVDLLAQVQTERDEVVSAIKDQNPDLIAPEKGLNRQQIEDRGIDYDDMVSWFANEHNEGAVQALFNEKELDAGAHYDEARTILNEGHIAPLIKEYLAANPKGEKFSLEERVPEDLVEELAPLREKIGATTPTATEQIDEWVSGVVDSSRWTRIKERFKEGMADDLRGLHNLEVKASPTEKLFDNERSAYKLGRIIRGINDVVLEAMAFGAPVWMEGTTDIDTSVKAPMEVLNEVGARTEEFQLYLWGKRAQELLQPSETHPEGRMAFTDISRAELQGMIDSSLRLGDTNADFEALAQDLYNYQSRLLDFVEQSGLINAERSHYAVVDNTTSEEIARYNTSREAMAHITRINNARMEMGELLGGTRKVFEEMNKNYVPFFRIMEDPKKGVKSPSARMGFSGQHPNFWKLKGGKQNIQHPLLNMEANIQRLIEASVKNVVMLRAEQLNADTQDMFMRKIPKEVRAAAVTVKQMVSDLKKMGLTIEGTDDINVDEIRVLWSLGNAPKGDNVVSMVRGGKVIYYEVTDPMLFRSLTQMNRKQIPLIAPFRAARHLLTAAVGLDPAYQIANFLRDTGHAAVVSNIGFRPVYDSIKGLMGRMKNDPEWKEFLRAGGGMSALLEADRPTMHRVIEDRLAKKKGWKKLGTIIDTPRGWIGGLERLESTFEYSTRLGAYKRLRDKGAKKIEAIYQARDVSTDFSMRGSFFIMRLLSDTVPFFNAGVQGLYRTGRGAAENPAAFLAKASVVAMASMYLWLLNKDDDRYKELDDYIKDTYWIIFYGDGPGDFFKIPKPFEIGAIFASMPERILELAVGKEGEDFATGFKFLMERMLWTANQMMRLDVTPQLLRPPLRIYANWDEFRERPVIPPWLEEDRLPEHQYDELTPQPLIGVGGMLGVSPKHVQAVIEGYLGTVGSYLVLAMHETFSALDEEYANKHGPQIERELADFPVFKRFKGRTVPLSTKYQTEFYKMREEVAALAGSLGFLVDQGEIDRARVLLEENKPKLQLEDAINKIAERASKINKKIRAVRASNLSGTEKKNLADKMRAQRNKLFKMSDKLKERYYRKAK